MGGLMFTDGAVPGADNFLSQLWALTKIEGTAVPLRVAAAD